MSLTTNAEDRTASTPAVGTPPTPPVPDEITWDEWLAANTFDWAAHLDDASGPLVSDIGSPDMTVVGSPEFQLADAGGALWMGIGTTDPTNASYATVISPIDSAAFTFVAAVQHDKVPQSGSTQNSKHVLLASLQTTAGGFSVEVIDDGAGGLQPRAFTMPASGGATVVVGTNLGSIPIGAAYYLIYIRQSDGNQNFWIVRNDGTYTQISMTVNSGTVSTAQSHPNGWTGYLGIYPTLLAPLQGTIRRVALKAAAISPAAIQSLAEEVRPLLANVVWSETFTTTQVAAASTTDFLLDTRIHPIAGVTPSITSQPSAGTASVVNSNTLRFVAPSPGSLTNYNIGYRITKGGQQSAISTLTVPVAASGGSDAQDTRWTGLGYTKRFQVTPQGSDIGVQGTTWLAGPWANGQPLNTSGFQSSSGSAVIAAAPDGTPSLRTIYNSGLPAATYLINYGGSQLGTGVDLHAVYSVDIWLANYQATGGQYLGLGHFRGGTPTATSYPGGSLWFPEAWTGRIATGGSGGFITYFYPARPSDYQGAGEGPSGSTVQPQTLTGAWHTLEMEVIQNTPWSASNGQLKIWLDGSVISQTGTSYRTRYVDPTLHGGGEHRPRGTGFFIQNNGATTLTVTWYYKNWRIYTKA